MSDFQPPKIIDRSDLMPGQMTLPGVGGHEKVPDTGVSPEHPLFKERHNPHVWGTLAHPETHNPFLDHGFSSPSDLPAGWDQRDGWTEENERVSHRVENNLQHVVNGGHPCVAVTPHVLHKVLDSGRLKNQFETGTSNGSLDEDHRGRNEYTNYGYKHHNIPNPEGGWFGRSESQKPEARPIYGYLAKDPLANRSAFMYGQHTLVLKKHHVWHRTSTTMSDSLGVENAMRPSPVQKVALHSAHPDEGNAWRAATPEEHLHESLVHHLSHSLDDRGSEYTEAQYHGGVNLNDVHYAVLRGAKDHEDMPALKAKLDQHKIPWIHIHRSYSPGAQGDIYDRNFHESVLRRALHYQANLVAAMEGRGMTKVIATRGGGVYLLDLGDGTGQVADTKEHALFPPKNLQAILARGYWEDCSDVDASDILPLVKPV